MNKFTIYLGLNDKDTKIQKYDDKLSLELVQSLAKSQGVECFTAIPCFGVYQHDNGAVVNEQTLKIEIMQDDIKELISMLKYAFNQECVMVTKEEINVEFI